MRKLALLALVLCFALGVGTAHADIMDNLVIRSGGKIILQNGANTLITSQSGDIRLSPITGDVQILEFNGRAASLEFVGSADTAAISYTDATNTLDFGNTGIATTGGIALTGGAFSAASLTADTGDITATLGDVIVSAGGVTVDLGNIVATSGGVEAGAIVTGGTGVIATTGSVVASAGSVDAATDISFGEALVGNVATLTCATPDALSLNVFATMVTSTTAADVLNLADGVPGQIVLICYVAETAGGDNLVITPANLGTGTTVTLAAPGEFCELIFDGTNWQVKATDGVLA